SSPESCTRRHPARHKERYCKRTDSAEAPLTGNDASRHSASILYTCAHSGRYCDRPLTYRLFLIAMTSKPFRLGTPLSPSATKVMLLGSGELGKEVIIALQRLGVEVIAVDRYADAPGQQLAHRSHV